MVKDGKMTVLVVSSSADLPWVIDIACDVSVVVFNTVTGYYRDCILDLISSRCSIMDSFLPAAPALTLPQ